MLAAASRSLFHEIVAYLPPAGAPTAGALSPMRVATSVKRRIFTGLATGKDGV